MPLMPARLTGLSLTRDTGFVPNFCSRSPIQKNNFKPCLRNKYSMALFSSACLLPSRTSIALWVTTMDGSKRNCCPSSFSFTATSKISCTRRFESKPSIARKVAARISKVYYFRRFNLLLARKTITHKNTKPKQSQATCARLSPRVVNKALIKKAKTSIIKMLSTVKFFIYISLSVSEVVLVILSIKFVKSNEVRRMGYEHKITGGEDMRITKVNNKENFSYLKKLMAGDTVRR
jgi:hypothetical protein